MAGVRDAEHPCPTDLLDLPFELETSPRLHQPSRAGYSEEVRAHHAETPRSEEPGAITHHRRVSVKGVDVFYREAGRADAPVVLLPHGYPGSSFVYRHLMTALGDRWRLIAPDLPGFGYSATPPAEDFGYTFDAYAEFLLDFTRIMSLDRYVLWLHDYGSQLGLRLAMPYPTGWMADHPERRHL